MSRKLTVSEIEAKMKGLEEIKRKAIEDEAKRLEEKSKKAPSKAEGESFWDTETPLAVIEAPTKKHATRIALTTKDGRAFVDIRTFVNKKGEESGYAQHTMKGCSIELTNPAELQQVIAALQRAGARAFQKKAVNG